MPHPCIMRCTSLSYIDKSILLFLLSPMTIEAHIMQLDSFMAHKRADWTILARQKTVKFLVTQTTVLPKKRLNASLNLTDLLVPNFTSWRCCITLFAMLHLSQIHLSITINEGKYILSQYFTLLIYIVLACSHLLMFLKTDT
jgi:hypothetical protein